MSSNILQMKRFLIEILDFLKKHKNKITFGFVILLIVTICVSAYFIVILNKKLNEKKGSDSNISVDSTTSTTQIEGRSESEHFILVEQKVEGLQLK